MTQHASPNVSRLSRTMALLSTAGFFLVPMIVVYCFLEPGTSGWLMFNMDHVGTDLDSSVPLEFRLTALACALVPTAFTMWALWSLRRLFLLYAQGSVFSKEALAALNHVAIALFAGVLAAIVMQLPISLALTWHRGPHHRELSLSLGSNDVATLFMAGVVLVIARVIAMAHRMADENAKFV